MSTYENTPRPNDEISIVDVVVIIRDFIRLMIRYWWMYAILGMLFCGGMLARAFFADPTFRASFTYMVEDNSASNGVSGILSQFGIGARPTSFNLDKILKLAKSRRIMSQTMFDRAVVDGEEDFIANHLISLYELDQKWMDNRPELEGFRFQHDSLPGFDNLELLAFKKTYVFLVGGEERLGLIFAKYDELSGILSMGMESTNMDLSIETTNFLFDNLRDYYVHQATEKQLRTYDVVQSKADSIELLISEKEIELAQFEDANRNLYARVDQVKRIQLEGELRKLHVMHAEALRNLEIADFAVKTATPMIQPIDRPMRPLTPQVPSKPVAIAIGVFLALMVGTIIILGINLKKAVDKRKIE